jgi:hypothetical protein
MELSSELSDQAVLQSFKMRGIPGSLTADGVAAIKRQLWKEADQKHALNIILHALGDYLERKEST